MAVKIIMYDKWTQLQDDIIHDRIYDSTDLIAELKKHRNILSKENPCFRARRIDPSNEDELIKYVQGGPFWGFSAVGSGPPPPEMTKQGRCNEKNEPVLYIAEDMYTALAEVRPGKRQRINIAEFRLLKDLKVIDIIYKENSSYDSLYDFLSLYFYIVYNDRDEYYKITQHIAKQVKDMGFDGIRYSSSLSATGLNIVLFDVNIAKCINSKVYQVLATLHYAEEQLPRKNNERLLPKSITGKFSNDIITRFLMKFKDG